VASSTFDFASTDQTIIIFDWDDTLCPSTCIKSFAQVDAEGRTTFDLDEGTREQLEMLADQSLMLIRSAQAMGKVVIVTNARSPWVDISCESFLPSLRGQLQDIPVIYAVEHAGHCLDSVTASAQQDNLLTETKVCAMRSAVSEFYSRYPAQSWKNILSIGDALFEHNAIRQVVGSRPMGKRCRTKTIKLLEGPTIAGMVVQLALVDSWLARIVQSDDDVDIDLSADERTVSAWSAQFSR
jgi:hypothetical protein